jgi:hypothetical protein
MNTIILKSTKLKLCSLLTVLMISYTAISSASLLGPDAYGYTGSIIPYDLRQNVSTLTGSGDDSTFTVALPFNFDFYGNSYSTVNISTNGIVLFGVDFSSFCCSGIPIPSNYPPNGLIAPVWMDWVTSIYTSTTGNVGSREFTVLWTGSEWTNSSNTALFEAILHETSNNIEFQYQNVNTGTHTAVSGIESPDNSTGIQQAYGGYSYSNIGYLYTTATNIPQPGTFALLAMGMLVFSVSRSKVARKK